MELNLGGYFRKEIVRRPEWIHAPSVDEVCSVSHCVSEAPDDWIDLWLHNELGWFNSPDKAAIATKGSARPLRLFAYRFSPVRYRLGEPENWAAPVDVQPMELDASFLTLGFDAVSKSMDSILGFECSPLSCCDLAAEHLANRFCLLDTLSQAQTVALQFSLTQPEPGPYFVVEVLESGHLA